MKNIYVLSGSEDGPMGVFSSHKKALAAAIDYCTTDPANPPSVTDTKYHTSIYGTDVSAEVYKDFIVNRYIGNGYFDDGNK
tara:strand:+ start:94 stop:336 length:243 start_codon:yes stop_codon:yes gene_type:complete